MKIMSGNGTPHSAPIYMCAVHIRCSPHLMRLLLRWMGVMGHMKVQRTKSVSWSNAIEEEKIVHAILFLTPQPPYSHNFF